MRWRLHRHSAATRISTFSARLAITRASSPTSRPRGYRTDVEDERWIAKVWRDNRFFDVIFAMSNGATPSTDEWFGENDAIRVYGAEAKITPPTELLVSKMFIRIAIATTA